MLFSMDTFAPPLLPLFKAFISIPANSKLLMVCLSGFHVGRDRKRTRLNSRQLKLSRMPFSA